MKRKMNEDLLIKALLGEATAEEKLQVESWLAENGDNQKEYDDFKLIWESSEAFALKSKVDENEAWNRFEQRLDSEKTTQEKTLGRKTKTPFWLKIAASILLVGIGLWISYVTVIEPRQANVFLTIQTLNETRTDTLSDGSIITLNKNSRLTYPKRFAKGSRILKMEEGEAFFEIAPDASKLFIVNVKDVKVQVVGTSFNIKTHNDHTELIVETGIVEVSKKDIVIRLKRNEKMEIDSSKDSFQKIANHDQLYKYYRGNEFIADDTPLWRLVEVLNEAYDADIIINGKDLENLTINTTFKDKSLDAIVIIICKTLNIKADKSGEQIVLYK